MRIKCIDNNGIGGLTIGKIYDSTDYFNSEFFKGEITWFYKIIDDNGNNYSKRADRFIRIDLDRKLELI